MNVIALTNSCNMLLVDDDIYRMLNKYTWNAVKSGNTYYARTTRWVNNKQFNLFAHRVVVDGDEIDHRNRDGLDCRSKNLRSCTHQQNLCNAHKPQGENGSGYRGVIKNKSRWSARIKVHNQRIHLGTFDTPEEAALAYNKAAIEYHGEFALLNEVTL